MKKLILLLCMILMLTGCSARGREPEQSAVVKALAFDKAKNGYELSAYIAGAEKPVVVSVTAETAGEGLIRLNTRTERKLSLEKNQVILISSEIRNVEEILKTLYTWREVRMEAKLIAVQGKAKDVLEYRGLYGETATDLEKTVENAWENANYPKVTLFGGVNSMAAEQGFCLLPMGRLSEENFVLESCCVYGDYRILQTLNEQEILGCALLRQEENVSAPAGEGAYALRELSLKHTCTQGENLISLKCTYRLLGGTEQREELERALTEAMGAAYDLAGKLGVNFLELAPCDVSLPARFSVRAEPAANDYPQEKRQ